jgi:hypothetical protein
MRPMSFHGLTLGSVAIAAMMIKLNRGKKAARCRPQNRKWTAVDAITNTVRPITSAATKANMEQTHLGLVERAKYALAVQVP